MARDEGKATSLVWTVYSIGKKTHAHVRDYETTLVDDVIIKRAQSAVIMCFVVSTMGSGL